MNYQQIKCFDLEMCCWDDGREPRTGEIIEIGIATLNIVTGEIDNISQYYVLPEKDDISPFCTQLTGITQKRLNKQGRPLGEVLESMTKKYGRHSVYGAWGRDNKVLEKECADKGLAMPFYEYLNLKTLFMMSRGIRKGKMGMRKCMEIAGLEFEGNQHSGVVDAFNLARLARAAIWTPKEMGQNASKEKEAASSGMKRAVEIETQ